MNCIEWSKSEMSDTWISKNNHLRIHKRPEQTFDVYDIRFKNLITVALNCDDLEQAKRIAAGYWLEKA